MKDWARANWLALADKLMLLSMCVCVGVYICVYVHIFFHLLPAAAICCCSPSPFAFMKEYFNSRLAEVASKLNRRL